MSSSPRPAGERVALNEEQVDLYGYRGHDASSPDPRLTVTAVLPSKDLAELARRLTTVGHSAEVVESGDIRSVHVTDPDGQHLEIHRRVLR